MNTIRWFVSLAAALGAMATACSDAHASAGGVQEENASHSMALRSQPQVNCRIAEIHATILYIIPIIGPYTGNCASAGANCEECAANCIQDFKQHIGGVIRIDSQSETLCPVQ
ncbi:hypothetical protein [Polyangium sp. y55x31]|uniref:hypothetical protein n=1 Tax=Polyangium sp. y55x31 TaxID=3042688 RepID=UPI0024822F0C|nr:hypothetical protein [Polyangium sp. y55x31]MDI1480104.1 hypothetical protein [Polyangium sp. y55x31]